MIIRNATPHALQILREDGPPAVFPVDLPAPRLAVTRDTLPSIDGFAVARPTMGQTTGLPDPVDGVYYVVSALVADANRDRRDLLSPGELVRDDAGKVVGAKGFCQYA